MKTIFSKYFGTSSFIILTSFVFLSGILFFLLSRYSFSEKEELMLTNARAVAQMTQELNLSNEVFYNYTLNLFATSIDSHIMIATGDGKVFRCTGGSSCTLHGNTISQTVMQMLITNDTEMTWMGNLGGSLTSTNYFTVAVPIHNTSGGVLGGVFVSSLSTGYSKLLRDILQMFVLATSFVMFVTFIMSFFATRRLVMPLRYMSHAVRSFSKGKFDIRIPIIGEDEIAELAVSFNNMAASLSNLEETRRSFIGNISHELKTPMTTIGGFIEGILDGTIPPDRQSYYLSIVSSEIRRLSRLVATLLELTRFQDTSTMPELQPFDICEMSRSVLVGFEREISAKSITVDFRFSQDSIRVKAVPDEIHRVLYNLTDNAIKFTNESGAIGINITTNDKKAVVSVRNTGIGIAPQDLPYVFERFYKSDKSRSLDKKGVGLGLYIVKTIIDRHNQEIRVNSVQGEFCEFEFTLELADAPKILTRNP